MARFFLRTLVICLLGSNLLTPVALAEDNQLHIDNSLAPSATLDTAIPDTTLKSSSSSTTTSTTPSLGVGDLQIDPNLNPNTIGSGSNKTSVDFKGMCESIASNPDTKYAECATQVSECGTDARSKPPVNCVFLSEPIGGEYNYDLYKVSCGLKPETGLYDCAYLPYGGEVLIGNEYVVQAILAYKPGAEKEGAFTLLYGYLALTYNYLTGLIIGFVILVVIIGGVMMTTAGGESEKFHGGRDLILKALGGMVLWFLASLILYTINPTFFAF